MGRPQLFSVTRPSIAWVLRADGTQRNGSCRRRTTPTAARPAPAPWTAMPCSPSLRLIDSSSMPHPAVADAMVCQTTLSGASANCRQWRARRGRRAVWALALAAAALLAALPMADGRGTAAVLPRRLLQEEMFYTQIFNNQCESDAPFTSPVFPQGRFETPDYTTPNSPLIPVACDGTAAFPSPTGDLCTIIAQSVPQTASSGSTCGRLAPHAGSPRSTTPPALPSTQPLRIATPWATPAPMATPPASRMCGTR